MKIRRGCGCMVLVLALLNSFIVITLLWGIASSGENLGMSLLMMVVFVANVAVCVMAGLPAMRREDLGRHPSTGGDEVEGADDQAESEDGQE